MILTHYLSRIYRDEHDYFIMVSSPELRSGQAIPICHRDKS